MRLALLDANGPTGTFSTEDARSPGDAAQPVSYTHLGLALMEFIWPIPTWLDVNPKGAEAFRAFRSDQGRKLLIEENRFIEQVLPGGVMRKLTDEAVSYTHLDVYKRQTTFTPREIENRFAGVAAKEKWASSTFDS